ncbi:hypothetical protein Tco_0938569 [Tanacetum coccineum]|uniref:Uncharacterized protein n=1 Tax=Tanacetum coccineum TaxID=301880 RepID=A0ABQ5DI77_9ASTR
MDAGSFGNPSEHSVEFESEIISVPKEVSESKSVTTNEKVRISEPKPERSEPIQLNAVRPNSNSVRPNVNTVRQNVNSVRSNVNTVRPKQPVPTRKFVGTAVKTIQQVIIEKHRPKTPLSNSRNPILRFRTVNAKDTTQTMEDNRCILDSDSAEHAMTVTKDSPG